MPRENGAWKGERPCRVVLLGGKALAIDCLESMLWMPEVEVAAVIPCADDDPTRPQWYPSLAGHAQALGLPVYQPRSANEPGFLPVLKELGPHLLVSIFYDKILKPDVLKVPSIGAANLHFGFLPYNRGSMPIPWAIIDGNDPGVTLHHMDPGVDTGDIIAQMRVPAADHETASQVYVRCVAAGRYVFERHLPLLILGSAPRLPQSNDGSSYYRPGYPFDRWIDWSQPAERIARFVRALTFPPYPSARTSIGGRELEVCHPVWVGEAVGGSRPGTVLDITTNWAVIATGLSSLAVRTMRLEGTEQRADAALRRAGCSIGQVLESTPWVKSQAA